MDLLWHALNSMLQEKTLYHTEKQGFGYPWLPMAFQIKIQMLKSSPVSERSAHPWKSTYDFPWSPL